MYRHILVVCDLMEAYCAGEQMDVDKARYRKDNLSKYRLLPVILPAPSLKILDILFVGALMSMDNVMYQKT